MGLLPGDILVLGSDGLFDNMWDSQLESIVREYIKVCIHSLALSDMLLAATKWSICVHAYPPFLAKTSAFAPTPETASFLWLILWIPQCGYPNAIKTQWVLLSHIAPCPISSRVFGSSIA